MVYGSFSFQTSRKIVFRLSKFIAWSVTLLIVHAILALSLMARLGLFMNVTAQLWKDKIYSFILLGTFEVQTRKTQFGINLNGQDASLLSGPRLCKTHLTSSQAKGNKSTSFLRDVPSICICLF